MSVPARSRTHMAQGQRKASKLVSGLAKPIHLRNQTSEYHWTVKGRQERLRLNRRLLFTSTIPKSQHQLLQTQDGHHSVMLRMDRIACNCRNLVESAWIERQESRNPKKRINECELRHSKIDLSAEYSLSRGSIF